MFIFSVCHTFLFHLRRATFLKLFYTMSLSLLARVLYVTPKKVANKPPFLPVFVPSSLRIAPQFRAAKRYLTNYSPSVI